MMADEFLRCSLGEGKICRRFIFKNDISRTKAYLINICQFAKNGSIFLSKVLLHLQKKGLNIKNYSFVFEKLPLKMSVGDTHGIPLDPFFKDKEYEVIMEEDDEEEKDKGSEEERKPREPERVIRDVLYKLKKWRALHEKCSWSLVNAAKEVGVKKKTLDDYYFAIRVGQIHGYQFESNLDNKIGHLREFIKRQQKKISGKLDRAIESFNLVPEPDLQEYLISDKSNWLDEIMEEVDINPIQIMK